MTASSPPHVPATQSPESPLRGAGDRQTAAGGYEYTEFAMLQRTLGEFGLSGNQTLVLLTLLRSGAATASQLSWVTDIPRTAVYPVLRALSAMGLAEPTGGASKSWQAPPRAELLARLRAVADEQLREQAARKELAHRKLVDVLPAPPASEFIGPVRLSRLGAETGGIYARCLERATTEVLVLNCGPFFDVGTPNPAVLEMLARGVTTRAIYQREDLDGPQGPGLRQDAVTYAAAGVETRIADHVPLKLAVFDRRVALFPLEDPEHPLAGDAPHLEVDHLGFAALARSAFERYWEKADAL